MSSMDLEDTGSRRRASDAVSSDDALELIASLAYEYALKSDNIDIHAVETAIMRCRALKVEETGKFKVIREVTQDDV